LFQKFKYNLAILSPLLSKPLNFSKSYSLAYVKSIYKYDNVSFYSINLLHSSNVSVEYFLGSILLSLYSYSSFNYPFFTLPESWPTEFPDRLYTYSLKLNASIISTFIG